jgi:ribonuclease J
MSTKDLRRRPGKKGPAGNELRFIPLGGLGQIGKNMFVLECGEDIIVVDCGLISPTRRCWALILSSPTPRTSSRT